MEGSKRMWKRVEESGRELKRVEESGRESGRGSGNIKLYVLLYNIQLKS